MKFALNTFTYQRRIAHVTKKISIRRGLSRILFERRMYHVRVAFLLRSRGVSVTYLYSYGKVQVGKDQEKAQSERDSHSKNRGGKKPN